MQGQPGIEVSTTGLMADLAINLSDRQRLINCVLAGSLATGMWLQIAFRRLLMWSMGPWASNDVAITDLIVIWCSATGISYPWETWYQHPAGSVSQMSRPMSEWTISWFRPKSQSAVFSDFVNRTHSCMQMQWQCDVNLSLICLDNITLPVAELNTTQIAEVCNQFDCIRIDSYAWGHNSFSLCWKLIIQNICRRREILPDNRKSTEFE